MGGSAGIKRGYALITALILLAVASLAVALAVSSATLDLQREREKELLFAGDQIRQAIQSYHRLVPPGGTPEYPKQLEDLLEDRRFPMPVRHLRRLYPDPMTGQPDWMLLLAQGIVGVHSRSTAATLQHAGFNAADAQFAAADHYEEWYFSAAPGHAVARTDGTGGSAGQDSTTVWLTSGPGEDSAVPPEEDRGVQRTDSASQRQAWCYQKYLLTENGCTESPPPFGKEIVGCLLHFKNLYEQCVASPSGP